MNVKFKVLSLMMALVLLLSACSGKKKEEEKVLGGYRESEITIPEGYQQLSNPKYLPDGRVIMIGTRTVEVEKPSDDPSNGKDDVNNDENPDKVDKEDSASSMDIGIPTPIPGDMPDNVYYENRYDILCWQDISAAPTVDPLKLPGDVYFEANNSLLLDSEGKPLIKFVTWKEETGGQILRLLWLPEIKGAGLDTEPAPIVKEMEVEVGDMYPNAIAMLANGQIAIASWDRITIFGQDGKKAKELSTGYINQMSTVGSNIVAIDGEKGELVYFDSSNFQETKRRKISRTILNNANNIVGLQDGSIYFCGINGVYVLEHENTQSEATTTASVEDYKLVLDPMMYSLADPNIYVGGFAVGNDKSLLIMANTNMYYPMYKSSSNLPKGYNQQKPRGFIYTWDPQLDVQNKTVLTVSALFADQLLRVAAFEFQKKHPDVLVKITQYYDKMENEMPWSDFIRAINTDILSGKTADVMFLDSLPLKSYSRRGILEDLTPYLDSFGGKEKLNMGIVKGMTNEQGKLYALPMQFNTYVLIGRKNVIDQVSDLQSLLTLDLEPDQVALVSMEKQYMFQTLLQANMPAFVDEKSGNYKFDSPEFIGFLELFDKIYNEAQNPPPQYPEYPEGPIYREDIGIGGKVNYEDFWRNMQRDRYFGKMAMNISYFAGLAMEYEFTLSGGKDASWTYLPLIKDMGGSVFNPSQMLGIGANSKNKDLAVEFVKMIFSGEIESLSNYMWGFSILKSQQEKQIQNILKQYKEQDENGWEQGKVYIDETLQVDMVRFTEEELRAIVNRLEECSIPIQYDQTLSEFMNEEMEPFLKGEKSAREAAESLQRRAAAYLGE